MVKNKLINNAKKIDKFLLNFLKKQKHSLLRNQQTVSNNYEVLIEGLSKKSDNKFFGRTSQNTVVVFDKKNSKVGDFVNVRINDCTSATLIGEII